MKRPSIALALVLGLASVTSVSSAQADTRYYDHASGRWMSTSDRATVRVGPSTRDGTTVRAAPRQTQAMRKPDARFNRQDVRISTGEEPGTIIIDTDRKFLYFVEGGGSATRYGVGVGKDGFSWGGTMKVGRKAEWPGWTPPAEMRKREKAKGRILPAYMPGGPENPLGARALYLYRGGADSLFRIHGTNQPWTIGQNMSSGCIRMMNDDVSHLYERAGKGTKVVVIGPGGAGRDRIYQETGATRQAENVRRPLRATIFGG